MVITTAEIISERLRYSVKLAFLSSWNQAVDAIGQKYPRWKLRKLMSTFHMMEEKASYAVFHAKNIFVLNISMYLCMRDQGLGLFSPPYETG